MAGQPQSSRRSSLRGPASPSRRRLHYARRLEDVGKYPLAVWPYHSMVGGIGHALVSAVEEAVFFHAIARQSPTRAKVTGQNP